MPPLIATVLCIIGILGLFWLDRDKNARTSIALWIPVVWLSLACSRSVGQWLQINPLDSPDQILEGSPIDRMVYTFLSLAGLIVLTSRGQRVKKLLLANAPILLFFLYCAASLLWSDYPGVAFKRWIKAIGDLIMVLVVLSEHEPSDALKRLLARMAYVLVPLSILFIKYYPGLGFGYGPWGGKPGYVGVTTNKNTLGVICLFLGVGALWQFLAAYQGQATNGRFRQLLAHGVILGMVLWLLWIANSMTSLSCFVMASALLLLANSRTAIRAPVILHVLIPAMLVASVSVLFLGISPSVLETMGRNPTLTDRTEVWSVLLSLVRNPLFGTGFESFWLGPRLEKLWSMYWWHPNEAHNGYLEVFLNLGWAGVALLAMIIARGYLTVFRGWHRNVSTGSLLLAYYFIGLVYNFTEAAFFRMMAPAWIFFLFAITNDPATPQSEVQPSGGGVLRSIETRPILNEGVAYGRSTRPLRACRQPTDSVAWTSN